MSEDIIARHQASEPVMTTMDQGAVGTINSHGPEAAGVDGRQLEALRVLRVEVQHIRKMDFTRG